MGSFALNGTPQTAGRRDTERDTERGREIHLSRQPVCLCGDRLSEMPGGGAVLNCRSWGKGNGLERDAGKLRPRPFVMSLAFRSRRPESAYTCLANRTLSTAPFGQTRMNVTSAPRACYALSTKICQKAAPGWVPSSPGSCDAVTRDRGLALASFPLLAFSMTIILAFFFHVSLYRLLVGL